MYAALLLLQHQLPMFADVSRRRTELRRCTLSLEAECCKQEAGRQDWVSLNKALPYLQAGTHPPNSEQEEPSP
jgi:hypothetical protein